MFHVLHTVIWPVLRRFHVFRRLYGQYCDCSTYSDGYMASIVNVPRVADCHLACITNVPRVTDCHMVYIMNVPRVTDGHMVCITNVPRVTDCPSKDLQSTFVVYPDSAISGYNMVSIVGAGLSGCQERCSADPLCLTFDLVRGSDCYPQDVTARDVPSWTWYNDADIVHYQKTCL